MELRELLQNYVNLSYKELWQEAYNSWTVMKPFFDKASENGDGTIFIISFLGSSLAADGQLSALESKLVCDLFGVDAATAKGLFENTNPEIVRIVDQVFDELLTNNEIKAAVLSFCLCFLAVDESITRDEVAFINRLLA